MRSNYVCAGGRTLLFYLDRFMHSKEFDDHYTKDSINDFFNTTCNKFLYSFGQEFSGQTRYETYNKRLRRLFDKMKNYGFMDKSELFVDSGGFQASIGVLDRTEIKLLFDLYYQFLIDHIDCYERAFILDIPPGPGCVLFDTFQDVYDLNLKSYLFANSLPSSVKEKLIYVHHFRTPKMWKIYTSIMKDNGFFEQFNYHAIGGVVANSAGDMEIPYIIYVLPLIVFINECKKLKRKKLKFHILGGATFRDILFYELFTIHVKKVHDIDLEITFDSSGLFKSLMVARYLYYFDKNNNIHKLNVKQDNLFLRAKGSNLKVLDVYKGLINTMCDNHNLKPINMDEIYCKNQSTFYDSVKVYSFLYMLEFYSIVQNLMKQKAMELHSLYENEKFVEFNKLAFEITQSINSGKITKKQKVKTNNILESLNILTDLNEESCEHIVNTYLSKDEFVELSNQTTWLTI